MAYRRRRHQAIESVLGTNVHVGRARELAMASRLRAPDPRKETVTQYYLRCKRIWDAHPEEYGDDGAAADTAADLSHHELKRRYVFLSNLPKHVARLLDMQIKYALPEEFNVPDLARRLDNLLVEKYGALRKGRNRFRRRLRQPGESMEHYLVVMEHLVEGCQYRVPAMRDAALVQQLKCGCGSRFLRRQLVKEGLYLTWDRARKIALVFSELEKSGQLPDDQDIEEIPRPAACHGQAQHRPSGWFTCKKESPGASGETSSVSVIDDYLASHSLESIPGLENFFSFTPSPAPYPEGTIWEIRLDPDTGENIVNPWIPVDLAVYSDENDEGSGFCKVDGGEDDDNDDDNDGGGDGDQELAIIDEEEMDELVAEIGKLGIHDLSKGPEEVEVDDEAMPDYVLAAIDNLTSSESEVDSQEEDRLAVIEEAEEPPEEEAEAGESKPEVDESSWTTIENLSCDELDIAEDDPQCSSSLKPQNYKKAVEVARKTEAGSQPCTSTPRPRRARRRALKNQRSFRPFRAQRANKIKENDEAIQEVDDVQQPGEQKGLKGELVAKQKPEVDDSKVDVNMNYKGKVVVTSRGVL